jgi:lysophospholipase L1-like esterase
MAVVQLSCHAPGNGSSAYSAHSRSEEAHIQHGKNADLMRKRSPVRWCLPIVALIGAVALPSVLPSTANAAANPIPGFVETWQAAPTAVPPAFVSALQNQTLRQIVHISVGGYVLRVEFTNRFGTSPMTIGQADVALPAAGGPATAINSATDRRLTFTGQTSTTIAAGAEVWSDPVSLTTAAGSNVAVSMYLPNSTPTTTMHASAYQDAYIAEGNVSSAADVTPLATTPSRFFLSGLAVNLSATATSNVVAFGDSITDGSYSTNNTNQRWPDLLAARMRANPALASTGVVNAGVGGNRLLHDADPPASSPDGPYGAFFGQAGVTRFQHDVLNQPGIRSVVVLIGVNDLGQPGIAAPASEEVTAAQLIAGYQKLISTAHANGVKIIGGTIMPFEGDAYGFWNPERETVRETVNAWIRTSGAFDGVVDFDAAMRDPQNPDYLNPAYSSGDGVHPNDAGMAALAAAVPLSLLTI